MLEKIEIEHAEDGEVLFRLAKLREDDRQPESAVLLIQQAIDAGYAHPEAYLKRARIRADSGDQMGAMEDAWCVLDSEQVAPPMLREAIGRLVRTKLSAPKELAESNAVSTLEIDDKFWLARSLNHSHEYLPIAVALWEQILAGGHVSAERHEHARHFLGLSYMGMGRCSDAARMFRKQERDIDDMSIIDAFNYGMAMWGVNGAVECEAFQHVVNIDRTDNQRDKTINYFQCMAVAYWATGDREAGLEYVGRAQASVRALRGRTEFSCWRYLQVSARSFEADLEEMRVLIRDGRAPLPRFMVPVASPKD